MVAASHIPSLNSMMQLTVSVMIKRVYNGNKPKSAVVGSKAFSLFDCTFYGDERFEFMVLSY